MIGNSFGNKAPIRDLYSQYLLNGSTFNAIGNYTGAGQGETVFSLPDTSGVVVVNVILVHLAADGKFKIDGYGSGTILPTGVRYQATGRNYSVTFPDIKTNAEIVDLMSEVVDIEYSGQDRSLKMKFDFSGIGDVVLDFSRGDNITLTLNDDFSTRLLRQTVVCRGYRVR